MATGRPLRVATTKTRRSRASRRTTFDMAQQGDRRGGVSRMRACNSCATERRAATFGVYSAPAASSGSGPPRAHRQSTPPARPSAPLICGDPRLVARVSSCPAPRIEPGAALPARPGPALAGRAPALNAAAIPAVPALPARVATGNPPRSVRYTAAVCMHLPPVPHRALTAGLALRISSNCNNSRRYRIRTAALNAEACSPRRVPSLPAGRAGPSCQSARRRALAADAAPHSQAARRARGGAG